MQYFKYINLDRRGERYFKINDKAPFPENEKCIQVVLHSGEMKNGRPHCLGIYTMKRLGMWSGYGHLGLVPCTKREYDAAFKKALKIIQ